MDTVREHIEELWGLLCPDMGVDEFEKRVRALGTVGPVGLPPKDEPARHPLDVRNMYELGN